MKSSECPLSEEEPGDAKLLIQLSKPYVSVKDGDILSNGGSQLWLDGMLKRCGCSVIAAADTLMYIEGRTETPISKEAYLRVIRRIRRYFPTIPFRGIPGFALPFFMNLLNIRRKNGFRAAWGCIPGKLTENIRRQLEKDIPVPACVGAGFHRIFKSRLGRGLRLYRKESGRYVWEKSVRNHFFVITGMEGDMAAVSSWGEQYYIDLKELEGYSLGDGFGLFTNIIRIKRLSGLNSSGHISEG